MFLFYKYVSKDDVDHIIDSIKLTYTLTEDWTGNLYYGITLKWYYVHRHVDISMPNYIKKKLQEYGHINPTRIHSCPYHPEPKNMGQKYRPSSLPTLPLALIRRVLNKSSSILYYTQAVDMMVLMGLSSIAVEQTKAIEKTMEQCIDLLNI